MRGGNRSSCEPALATGRPSSQSWIAAAVGTVFFGIFVKVDEAVGDFRTALLYAGFLFIPSAAFALMLPSEPEQADGTASAVD